MYRNAKSNAHQMVKYSICGKCFSLFIVIILHDLGQIILLSDKIKLQHLIPGFEK